MTPFELLAYFRDAEVIVTDTFHGTIFSIINNRPFVTIIRKSVGNEYGNEEKLGYLLQITGTGSQRLDSLSEKKFSETLSYRIDYSNVNKILKQQREEAKKFLEKNIL